MDGGANNGALPIATFVHRFAFDTIKNGLHGTRHDNDLITNLEFP